jgi:subtilisin family serine protease
VNGADDDGNGLVDDWSGWDFVNDDNDPTDDHDHGTHVSGTIGAAGDNGVGVVGVNWNVKLIALKFLNAAGSGTTADAIASTLYAADHGADVASNSWGGGPSTRHCWTRSRTARRAGCCSWPPPGTTRRTTT